jgi:hypothetical protein
MEVVIAQTVMRNLEDRVRLAQTVLDFARAIRERRLQEA